MKHWLCGCECVSSQGLCRWGWRTLGFSERSSPVIVPLLWNWKLHESRPRAAPVVFTTQCSLTGAWARPVQNTEAWGRLQSLQHVTGCLMKAGFSSLLYFYFFNSTVSESTFFRFCTLPWSSAVLILYLHPLFLGFAEMKSSSIVLPAH